jgi:signal transduction histidine kinase
LKKIVLILLNIIIIFSCNKKKNNIDTSKSNIKKIDSLLLKANNTKLEKVSRIKYADSAVQLLNNKTNDSITRDYYFQLSNSYYNLDENQKNLVVCLKVNKLSEESKDSTGLARSYYFLGDHYYSRFTNDSAYYYFTKAEKIYRKIKITDNILRIQYYKAVILFYEKDFTGCETAIVNVLKGAKKENDVRLVYDCYIMLGNALDGLNYSDKAIEYYNKAYSITKDLENDSQYVSLKAQAYGYIGRLYQKNKNYTKSIIYLKDALEFGDFKTNNPLLYSSLINDLAFSRFKLGDSSSLNQLKEALKIRMSLNRVSGIIDSQIRLAEYFLNKKDYTQAYSFAHEAQQKAHYNNIFEDELKALELLAKIDPKNANNYNNRFIKLTDSLYNNERAVRNKFARIAFETDEITSERDTIQVEKNEIFTQLWMIVISGILIIALIVFAYFNRVQLAKNKELQYEQAQQKANEEIYKLMLEQQSKIDEGRKKEKKRISQELHDGIMSRLTSTRLNLFVLSKKTDEETIKKCLVHVADLQNIEKEIRTISHDLANDTFTKKDSYKLILENLIEQQKEINAAEYHLEIDSNINWDILDSNIKMHLYRITQECFQNIFKYAKANNVNIIIAKRDEKLKVEIIDDGVGFDIEKTKDGIGLKNMQSRMASVGGGFDIYSSPKRGTQISLFFPI